MTDASQFRANSIFLPRQTHHALRMVAKAAGYTCTDQLAESIITGWLETYHKDVVEHIAAQQKASEEFAEQLKKNFADKQTNREKQKDQTNETQ